MNILMMTNTYMPIVGGLERSVQSLSRELRKLGHGVVIAAPQFSGSPAHEKGVVRVPAIKNFQGTDFSLALPVPMALRRLLAEFRPDLIHAHHPFLMGDVALRLARQAGLPLVFTYHTMFEQYLHFLPFQNDGVKRFILTLAVGFANLADRVIAPCESVRDLLAARGVKRPIDVVPTGVDARKFAAGDGRRLRREAGIPKHAFVIGTSGRLSQEKNLEFMARAVAPFLVENRNAHFLAVGQGPAAESVASVFASAGVGERVHFTGVLKGDRLVDGYGAMDVFAFTSKSETQGMVVTEAMASGLPVVALSAPGVREIVQSGRNGLLVAEENERCFSEALREIALSHALERAALSEGARRTARALSVERCALRALETYEKAAAFHTPSRRLPLAPMVRRGQVEWSMLKNLGKAAAVAIGGRTA